MIYHLCYSIIHESFFTIFPISVPQVQKKCRKNIQNMFTEQRSPFLIPIVIYLLSDNKGLKGLVSAPF